MQAEGQRGVRAAVSRTVGDPRISALSHPFEVRVWGVSLAEDL